jgi:hypothetical protein
MYSGTKQDDNDILSLFSRFRPLRWFKRNLKDIIWLALIILVISLIVNPSGTSKTVSDWFYTIIDNFKR